VALFVALLSTFDCAKVAKRPDSRVVGGSISCSHDSLRALEDQSRKDQWCGDIVGLLLFHESEGLLLPRVDQAG